MWKTVPWEGDIEAKTTMDYLVDVLADIPCFIQLLTPRSPSSPGIISENLPGNKIAKAQLPRLLKRLKDLHQVWEAQYPNSYWEATPSPRSPSAGNEEMKSPPPPFETVLHFADLDRAYDFCLFNATLLLVLLLLEESGESQLVSKFLQEMFPACANFSKQVVANLICRSADYLLLDKHGSLGYILWTFSAAVTYIFMDKTLPQAKYVFDITTRNSASSGFGFGDFVLKWPTPLSMWMEGCKARHQQQAHYQSPETLASTPDEEMTNLLLRPQLKSGP